MLKRPAGKAIFQACLSKEVEQQMRSSDSNGLFHTSNKQQTFVCCFFNYNGWKVAMLTMDIDYFKRINDTHGHQMGDTVLQEWAGYLKDEVGSADILARLGGEEFVVPMPDVALREV